MQRPTERHGSNDCVRDWAGTPETLAVRIPHGIRASRRG